MFLCTASMAEVLDDAINKARDACAGIAGELDHLKTMAGINTAVTGVGTLAGGGAIATGFIKQSKDKKASRLEELLARLKKIEQANPVESSAEEVAKFEKDFDAYYETAKKNQVATEAELAKLNKQSKSLGNWRTGLLVGNTATNVAGAIIAGGNKVSGDLKSDIDDCKAEVKALGDARQQARIDGAEESKLALAEKIIAECGKFDLVDVSSINSKALIAQWSSVAGAGIGAAGTVTSAIANTDKTRAGDQKKEKNLNTASNALAIGATAASAVATIFNAVQISAIKKASDVADNCEEALR
jgi:uncharacterized membrane protein